MSLPTEHHYAVVYECEAFLRLSGRFGRAKVVVDFEVTPVFSQSPINTAIGGMTATFFCEPLRHP